MPANLPPEYFEAEKRFKAATDSRERVAALEALIATVPKHKGTDKLRADLRRKLSQLREEAARKKKSGRGDLFAVERQGAAQVALVGLANVGKSSLVGSLTNAHPVIADYPLSTVAPLSGMMPFENIQFQLVDLPPIGNESTDGWVSGILRHADVLLLVLDLLEDPDVQAELLIDRLAAWRIPLKDLTMNEAEREGKKPAILVLNKTDLPGAPERAAAVQKGYGARYPAVVVSTATPSGIEDLRRSIFANAGIIRVYSKEPGKEPDLHRPFVLPRGAAVLDLAAMIHKDFRDHLKYACIWGSARFEGQRVQKDYLLRDGDIVEYHVK